jgi:PTH1 family peptidyl-tRNA hydrolase
MTLIVGLGNPGKKFEKTWHNLGFMTVEALRLKIKSFSDWKKGKKLQAKISQGKINKQKIILAKPQSFMNLSGKVVKSLIENWKLEIGNLIIVHDDIDIPLGKIKIVKNRGAAGHKGVESIIKELGSKKFVRFRIGIQPKTGKPKNLEKFVLQKFTKDEEKTVKKIIKKTAKAIEVAIKEGVEKAMMKYNK